MLTPDLMHDYQLEDVQNILEHTHYGLLLDMGLGKTVTTLTAIDKLLYEELAVSKVLVIAPKTVTETVWVNEVQQWSHLAHLNVVVVAGTAEQRRRALRTPGDIYCISRDNVAWLEQQYPKLKGFDFDMLVVDESSSFKNPASKRFKALRRMAPRFKRVIILTGTFAPNGLTDIWSQIYLLDRGARLGSGVMKYRAEYFYTVPGRGYNSYELRPGSDKRIHEKIGDVVSSRKAKDFLKSLPGRMDLVINVHMSSAEEEAYRQMEKDRILELRDAEITALTAATLSNKLLQMASGAVYDEDKGVHQVHEAKIDKLKEIVEDLNGNPVLIAWNYKHEEDRIHKALKAYKPVKYKGPEEYAAWNRGEIQVLTMHPASGGHGLNLQKGGHHLIWFSPNWSLELEQQLTARLHRQGQQNEVMVYRLATKGTMDENVLKALKGKETTQDAIIDAVKARARAYDIHFQ